MRTMLIGDVRIRPARQPKPRPGLRRRRVVVSLQRCQIGYVVVNAHQRAQAVLPGGQDLGVTFATIDDAADALAQAWRSTPPPPPPRRNSQREASLERNQMDKPVCDL